MRSKFAHKRVWGPIPKYPLIDHYVSDDKNFIAIAGPCSVESESQIVEIAKQVAAAGATHLRGGLFRAGTYPGENFGLIDWKFFAAFKAAALENNLKTVIEVLDYSPTQLVQVAEYADCFQVGCRQMQNYSLLKKLAAFGRPVFIKRHPGSTIDEWLGAGEYILKYGSGFAEPVFIERGSSSHVNHVRWDLSLSMIPAIHAINPNLKVIVDAAHGTGRRDLVAPMTLAGVAAGADGCLVEVHQTPEESLSDADQAIEPSQYFDLMKRAYAVRNLLKGEIN